MEIDETVAEDNALISKIIADKTLIQFHQWFCTIDNLSLPNNLDENFERIYLENIFKLHQNNVIEIWKLFLNNFKQDNLTLMKIFSIFLSHIKISNEPKKWNDLIDETVMKIKNIDTAHDSLFNIYGTLAYFRHSLKFPVQKIDTIKLSDLSDIFPETDAKYWNNFCINFNALNFEDKLSFIKVMIFHYKLLKWNYGENFSNIQWFELIKEIVLIISVEKQLFPPDVLIFIFSELTDYNCHLEILMNHLFLIYDYSKLLPIFNNDSNWENHYFQNAFTNVIINKIFALTSEVFDDDKYWLKYGCDTPDVNNKKHGRLIQSIQKIAQELLNETFNSNVGKCRTKLIVKLLQFYSECVPIEYLSPFNQILCIIVFSRLFYLIKKSKSCQIITKLQLRLWNSVRRMWLFDFISASDFIYTMLYILSQRLKFNCRSLLEKYINILLNQNDFNRIYQSMKELLKLLNSNHKNIQYEYILMIESILFRQIHKFYLRFENADKFQPYRTKFVNLRDKLNKIISDNVQLCSFDSLEAIIILEEFLQTEVEKIIIFQEDNSLTKWNEIVNVQFKKIEDSFAQFFSDENLKNFLIFILKNRTQLTKYLSDTFIINMWHEIMGQYTKNLNVYIQKIINSETYWRKIIEKKKYYHKFQSISNDLFNVTSRNDCFQQGDEWIPDILKHLFNCANIAELDIIIRESLSGCVEQDPSKSIFFVHVLANVAISATTVERIELLKNYYEQIINSMIVILFIANKDFNTNYSKKESTANLRILILTFCKNIFINFTQKNLFTNDQLFSIYNIINEIKINNYCDQLSFYTDIFSIMNEVIFEIISKRSILAMKSVCSFLNIITAMMVSLIQASNEKNFTNFNILDREKLENCSKCFQKTLIKLAKLDEFRPYSLHLIAYYLEYLMDSSILVTVKEHLTGSIYHLIDMIVIGNNDNQLELCYSKLNERNRYLFKRLLEHYECYHRFKGFV